MSWELSMILKNLYIYLNGMMLGGIITMVIVFSQLPIASTMKSKFKKHWYIYSVIALVLAISIGISLLMSFDISRP